MPHSIEPRTWEPLNETANFTWRSLNRCLSTVSSQNSNARIVQWSSLRFDASCSLLMPGMDNTRRFWFPDIFTVQTFNNMWQEVRSAIIHPVSASIINNGLTVILLESYQSNPRYVKRCWVQMMGREYNGQVSHAWMKRPNNINRALFIGTVVWIMNTIAPEVWMSR